MRAPPVQGRAGGVDTYNMSALIVLAVVLTACGVYYPLHHHDGSYGRKPRPAGKARWNAQTRRWDVLPPRR